MKIALASDHGGFVLKQEILNFLHSKKIVVEDLGCRSEEPCDYPDFAAAVAGRVSKGDVDAGILLCGTGIGMCIAANKFKRIRAALVMNEFMAKMAKEHNDANILCLGGRTTHPDLAKRMVAAWLDAKFPGDRHQRRIDKISELER